MLESSFVLISTLLIIFLFIAKYMIVRPEYSKTIALVTVTFTFLFLFYVINILLLVLFKFELKEIFLLIFAAAPFIIGKYASWQKISLFTNIQILIILIGILYMFFCIGLK